MSQGPVVQDISFSSLSLISHHLHVILEKDNVVKK
jgi:hypothetical protein